jgi:serine/threonine-protein kinase HipA
MEYDGGGSPPPNCAKTALMKRGRAEAIVQEICTAVKKWPEYADLANVPDGWRNQIYENLRLDWNEK